MNKLIIMVALVLAMFSTYSCKEKAVAKEDSQENHDHSTDKAVKEYICPMDCEKGKFYHKMGKCPVCKMDLIKKEHEDHDGHDHHEGDGHDHKEGDGHDHKEGDGHEH